MQLRAASMAGKVATTLDFLGFSRLGVAPLADLSPALLLEFLGAEDAVEVHGVS